WSSDVCSSDLRYAQTGPSPEHGELRRRNAVIRKKLLRERLVPREQKTARVAPGVRLAHQLEKRDDMLIVRDDAVELLQQIERDVRFPLSDRGTQLGQAVEDAYATHFVARLAQRAGDVVLGTPLFDLFFREAFQGFRGDQTRMHDYERAKFSHTGKCGVSPCP